MAVIRSAVVPATRRMPLHVYADPCMVGRALRRRAISQKPKTFAAPLPPIIDPFPHLIMEIDQTKSVQA